jgi:hypothetical protein
LLNPGRQADLADLHAQLIAYAVRVEELPSPEQVLNELHAVTNRHLPLQVMEAARFPLKSGDWDAVQLGRLAFFTKCSRRQVAKNSALARRPFAVI